MMDIKLGDLIMVRGTSLIDRGIESVSHSPYSHVAGIVKPNELIEAQLGRDTGFEAVDAYMGDYDVFTCDTLTDAQRAAIVQFVMGKVGTPYNIALIGWEWAFYTFHISLPMPRDEQCYDCSDLWRAAYMSVGVDLCPGLPHVSPGDLAESELLRKV